MGYPDLLEEQSIQLQGYFEALVNIDDGLRQNTGKSFIGQVKNRKNLFVAFNAYVTKIIVDKTTKEVKGVKVKIGEKMLELHTTKEIILSAGTVSSAQVLMLSGVGPEEHLTNVNIEPLVNLPVGKNLQDHIFFVGLFVKLGETAVKALTTRKMIEDIFEYFMFKTGELATVSLAN